MKKKLIAIVTSLAMVATMVPSVAFATDGGYTLETAKTAIQAGGVCSKDENAVTYDQDYAQYKELSDAIAASSDGDDWDSTLSGGDTAAAYGAFKKAVTKLTGYDTVARAAVAKVVIANTSVTNADNNLDDATDINSAVSEVDKIGTALEDGVTCKISTTEGALKVVINQLYPNTAGDGQTSNEIAADPERYTNYLNAIKLGKAITALKDGDVTGVTTAEDITTDAIAAKVDAAIKAFNAIPQAVAGKIATTLAEKAETLDTAYTAYLSEQQDEAAADFLKVMKAYGDATKAPAYSATSDTNINALCVEYLALAAVDRDGTVRDRNNIAPEVARLKSLIKTQWDARDTQLTAAIEAVSGKIASTSVIDDLKELDQQFYGTDHSMVGVATNVALYTVLTDTVLNLQDVKSNANTLKTKTTDAITQAETARTIITQIDSLPVIDDSNYDTQKTAVQAARTAYDGLNSTIQTKVGNYSKLTKAETDIKTLEKQVDDAVSALKALDTTIPTASTINSIKSKYQAANDAYNALKPGQKDDSKLAVSEVANKITALATVKTQIENYEKQVASKTEAETLISQLEKGTAASEALQIAQAETAVKKAVTDGTSRADIKGIGALDDARKSVIAVIYPNGKADAAAVAAAVKPVQDLIVPLKDLNIQTASDVRQVKAARAAYDSLVQDLEETYAPGSSTAMKEALKAQLSILVDVEEVADKIDSINTAAIEGFITAVTAINASTLDSITKENTVTSDYIGKTTTARNKYNALTDEQKEMIEADEVEDAKLAYDKLLIAEANVNSAASLPEVAKLIKAVPNATTLDVNDTASVEKVKAAQAAYEALSTNIQNSLVTDNYITLNELNNYKDAVEKVENAENEAAAKVAIDAINALPALPDAFENQGQVEPVQTALAVAEKAYNSLTDAQKTLVTNASDLATYRNTYDSLLKRYVDPLYAEAAKIDVETELTAEDIAIIAELKAYVEGKYIDTAKIKDFDQIVYDKLIEALDKVQKEEYALENAEIAAIANQTYTGNAIEPTVTVTDKAGNVVNEEDYSVTYINNVNAGTAIVVIVAKSESAYAGAKTAEFTIDPANLQTVAKAGTITRQTYNKKAKTPAVTVTAGDKKLVSGSDYTVKYTNNTNIGKATATITGTGNYKGTITTTFIIAPAKGSITSLKAGKKQITVGYAAQKATSGKTGYRIVYSPAKGQAKAVQTTAASKTIKSLKSGKTYKVKVRAYKTINGTKYNGTYSTVKKVKVK